MTLHEVVLFYDNMSDSDVDKMKKTCRDTGAQLKRIGPDSYRVPLGFLCYGDEDQIREYLVAPESVTAMDSPMLVLAGFTNDRLHKFLGDLKNQGVPPIALKAVLTEYNATWDSLSLYEELKKEDEYMRSSS